MDLHPLSIQLFTSGISRENIPLGKILTVLNHYLYTFAGGQMEKRSDGQRYPIPVLAVPPAVLDPQFFEPSIRSCPSGSSESISSLSFSSSSSIESSNSSSQILEPPKKRRKKQDKEKEEEISKLKARITEDKDKIEELCVHLGELQKEMVLLKDGYKELQQDNAKLIQEVLLLQIERAAGLLGSFRSGK